MNLAIFLVVNFGLSKANIQYSVAEIQLQILKWMRGNKRLDKMKNEHI